MAKYIARVRFTFEGDVEIEADSKNQAREYVDCHVGMTIGNVHSTIDFDEIDWEFPVHPVKKIKKIVRKN